MNEKKNLICQEMLHSYEMLSSNYLQLKTFVPTRQQMNNFRPRWIQAQFHLENSISNNFNINWPFLNNMKLCVEQKNLIYLCFGLKKTTRFSFFLRFWTPKWVVACSRLQYIFPLYFSSSQLTQEPVFEVSCCAKSVAKELLIRVNKVRPIP